MRIAYFGLQRIMDGMLCWMWYWCFTL